MILEFSLDGSVNCSFVSSPFYHEILRGYSQFLSGDNKSFSMRNVGTLMVYPAYGDCKLQ